jgi:hypothetical protein
MRFRSLVAALAIPALVLVPAVSATAAPAFSDVPPSKQFYTEITWLAEQGISTGYPDGTFRPLNSVKRDAMAAFLYRLAGEPAFSPPAVSPFWDVPTSNQFYSEITWLASTGISTGYPDGTFRPLSSVGRDAMAAFMYRFEGSPAHSDPAVGAFRDVPVGTQFFHEIAWLADEGISTGYDEGFGCHVFAPTNPVNRDAMAAFMYRLVNGGTGSAPSGDTCHPNLPPTTGAIAGNAGTLVVGSQVAPGTYRMTGYTGTGCYVARLSGFGADDIIENDYFATSRGIVTISPGDVGFESYNCGNWYGVTGPSGTPITTIPGNGGTYIVNWEIVPGTYQSTGNDGCYWERNTGFGMTLDEVIDNGVVYGGAAATVTIQPTDTGFITDHCGTWHRIG